MDIVLEVADTFIFDYIYSSLLPAAPLAFPSSNATFSSVKQEPTSFALPAATWQYEPATKYFSVQPRQAAFESAWPRDDWRRQLLTLYLITWYAVPLRFVRRRKSGMLLTRQLQAIWRHCVLRIRVCILLLGLRQSDFRTPSIPKEPDQTRNEAS